MGIFTKQEGLFPVLGKIVFDFRKIKKSIKYIKNHL